MLWRVLTLQPLRHNAAEFLRSVARQYGDFTYHGLAGHHIYLLNHPDLIADFFGKDSRHHHRNPIMQRSRDVLGNGLLTSEEPLHMRQRRLMQPAFLRQRIASYGAVIGAKTVEMTGHWRSGTVLDLHREMLELALRIVLKCLFDLDRFSNMPAMESAVNSFMYFLPLAFVPFSRQIQASPLASMRRLREGNRYLDELIYGMIAERRADPRDRGDLLSMLLAATDTETGDSSSMTDQQLRDECVTVILAGHETTANALSFALDLLARHPEVQERLHDEAAAVLGERTPGADDYPRLPYATQIFAEAMRLYPPVWITGRTAAEPYEVAGFRIPAGAAIHATQYTVHRDPRWWNEPDRFDPERFTESAKASRPRNTYFPFAGGSRQCIAEGLAWMEGTLVLAVLARDWRLSRPPGHSAPLAVRPAITLRPAKGVPLSMERR